MYAKVFCQIFDSSIADDFQLRHFFMDLLVLADMNGVVDMTPTAIAARTRIPVDVVKAHLDRLASPDAESRTAESEGRRIALLDEHRTWGWQIINYARFREIASEEQRRERTRLRVAAFRDKQDDVTPCNAPVTQGNACNAIQREKQIQTPEADVKEKGREPASPPAPYLAIHAAWNSLVVVPQCLIVSDKRRRMIESRWKDEFFQRNWKQALEKIKTSRFCQGDNDRGWTASFDWFLNPDTCTRLMEGKYQNYKPKKVNRSNAI